MDPAVNYNKGLPDIALEKLAEPGIANQDYLTIGDTNQISIQST
jgi:hypothetical protein